MKNSFRFNVLFSSVLLLTLILSGCGGGAGSSTMTFPATASFAYLRDTAVGPYPGVPEITSQRVQHGAAHLPAATNIAAGPLDAYLFNASTGTQTKLSSVTAEYRDIDLSPDGSKVVFTARDNAGYSQIFVSSISDFDNPTQLTSNDTLNHYNARFSLDGAMILSTIDQHIGSQVLLSLSKIPTAGGQETVISPPGMLKCWSPSLTLDGSKLIFEGQLTSTTNAAIFSINVDGTGLTQLTNPGGSYWDWRVSLSPNGTQMLFTRHAGSGGLNNIYVVGIGGESAATPAKQLTTDGHSWDSIYLTDYILFVSSKDNLSGSGNNNIYGMKPDGSGSVRITNTSLEDAFDLSAI